MVATIAGSPHTSAWGALLAAGTALLLIGGVLGNLAVSRRRAGRRPSVYDALRRRLAERTPGGGSDR